MIGELEDIVKEMQSGVYDYTVNDECSNCGQCCSALLPVSRKEMKEILRYVKKHNIAPCYHDKGLPMNEMPTFDLTCPFRDNIQRVCKIYPVRPLICKEFRCDKPKKYIEIDRNLIKQTRDVVDMWRIFG